MEEYNNISGQVKRVETPFQANYFEKVEIVPMDPILKAALDHRSDTDPKKMNLSIGAYRDDNGQPYIFPVVRKVEQEILSEGLDKEYLLEGIPGFLRGAQELIFGPNSLPLQESRVASLQTISGTGALRVAFDFLSANIKKTIYISNPTWANHPGMVTRAKLNYVEYAYYDPSTKSFDVKGMLSCLEKAEAGSIILLHACAHNPTGVDPSREEWKKICQVMKRKGLFPFFDTAYQGFASGDLDRDAWAIRYFIDQGFQMMVAESFGKNMGLYGERVGALHVVCSDKSTSEKVKQQIMVLVRQMYLSPPLHGARIAERVLCNPTNIAAWKEQLKQVASRIIQVRILLRSRLEELNTPGTDERDLGTWNHITDQIGMFSYTGLTEKQCSILIHKYHIHLLSTGRISLSGVNTKNVEHLAECIKASIDEAAE